MMVIIEQSTTITIQLGPFLDEDDGKTAETGLTISSTDVYLSKNGAAFANPNDANAATHDASGWYRKQINTTDTNTLGRLVVMVHESGALPVWREFMVVPSNVWDSLVGGTDKLQVHADEITNGLITAAAIATDAITSDEVAASGANKIADHTIRRTFQNACDSSDGDTKTGRSLLGAIGKLVNKVASSGGTLTVYEDDDTTSLFTQSVTTDSGADPITELDTT